MAKEVLSNYPSHSMLSLHSNIGTNLHENVYSLVNFRNHTKFEEEYEIFYLFFCITGLFLKLCWLWLNMELPQHAQPSIFIIHFIKGILNIKLV